MNTDRSICRVKIVPLFSLLLERWSGEKKLAGAGGEVPERGAEWGIGSHRNRFERRAESLTLTYSVCV